MPEIRAALRGPLLYLLVLAAAGTILFLAGGVATAPPIGIAIVLSLPLLLPPFRRRQLLRSALALAAVLLLVLTRLAVRSLEAEGETSPREKARARVEVALRAEADSLLARAEAITKDPKLAPFLRPEGERSDREALFRLLEEWGEKIERDGGGAGPAIEVRWEGNPEPIVWWGDVPDLGAVPRGGPIRLASDPLRLHLVADAPLYADSRRTPAGFVRLSWPIGPNPELPSGVGREVPFAAEMRRRVGGEALIDLPGGEGEFSLSAEDGSELGRLRLRLPSVGERTEAAEGRAATGIGLLLLVFWASFLPWRAPEATRNRFILQESPREIARRLPLAAIVGLRALLLLFDYPARLGGGGAVAGPESFTTPVLFGACRSPADAALTGLVLLLVFLSARERAVRRVRAGDLPAGPRFPLLLLGLLLLAASTAAFGALVREICLSTTLSLFAGPNPIGPPALLLVEISLFFLAAAYLLLVDAIFVWAAGAARLAHSLPDRLGFPSRVLSGAAAALAVLFLTGLILRGGAGLLALPAAGFFTGLLLLFLLRGRGWRVWSGFGLVAAIAVVLHPYVREAREETARLRLEEKALRFAEPEDEWKRFLLEETLRFLERDPVLIEKLSREASPPMEREAFLAWARSGLARYDYSLELRILDRQGAVVSRFALDMPAESAVRAAFAFRDVRSSGSMRIYEGRRRLRGESMEVYTGAVPLYREGDLVGAVMISIPYFYENLEYAAKLPSASHEVFRNLRTMERTLTRQTDGLQAILYRAGEAVLSSSEHFPAETRLDADLLRRIEASGSAWSKLRIDGKTHEAFFARGRNPEGTEILAFAEARGGPLAEARALIDIVLGSLFFALLIALLLVPLYLRLSLSGSARGAYRFETTFRDRLVLAFLVVAILPALLLGGAGRRMVASRLREAGETAARTSLQAVRFALERDAVREAEEIARSTLVRRRVLGVEESEDLFDLELSLKRFAIFSPDGRLLLQNGKVEPPEPSVLADVRERRAPVTAFDRTEGLSLVSLVGITLEGFEERLEGILLLSKSIDDDWTAELSDRTGVDISFFEEGKIHSSTRYELYQSGILSPRLPAAVYLALDLKGEEVRFGRESLAGTAYLVGYGSLPGLDGRPVGTVAVPLLSREREAARDLEGAYAAITYLTFLVLVVVVLLAETVGERIARPVRDLSRGMDRISAGDLEQAVPVRTGGEFGRLVRAFNRMTGELRRKSDALVERTRYIETVLGSVGAGVIAFDREGRIASANRAAGEILAVPARDLLGTRLDLVAGGRLEPLHRIVAAIRPGAAGARELEAELPRGGAVATLRVVATAITDAGGGDLGTVIVFEDLTDLIRSKKLLAWGEMARQVAHEIKNPLTPMKLSVQHLKRAYHDRHERFGELLDESADLIIEEIATLQRIATEFSTFARMPRREIRPVPAGDLLAETIRLYGEAGGGPGLEVDAPGDLPVLHVDREEIRRVLINLIENAVQAAGGRGRIRLSVRVEEGSPRNDEGWKLWESTAEERVGGRMVTVRIRDEGPGVAEEARGKLFEPNFSTKTDGTGLGLAICRAIVADYGGVLAIGSTPGVGTVAVVSLPVPVSAGTGPV